MDYKIIKNDDSYMIDFTTNTEEIAKYIEILINYIYTFYSLDHKATEPFYKNIKINNRNAFDHRTDSWLDDKWRDMEFVTNPKKDHVYFFEMFKDINIEYFSTFEEKHIDFILKIDELLKKSKNIIFYNFVHFELSNSERNGSGVYSELRGIYKLDWKLHYWSNYQVINTNSITLNDIMTTCFKIKSHKFDNWYELYCGIQDVSCKKQDRYYSFKASVDFDHGS